MTVHLFSAVSSPGRANFVLKRTADDFKEVFGSKPAEFVKQDFYVDDGLKSVPSESEATSLIQSTKELCAKGGFNLHKFVSNSKNVLEAIHKDKRAKGVMELNLNQGVLPWAQCPDNAEGQTRDNQSNSTSFHKLSRKK